MKLIADVSVAAATELNITGLNLDPVNKEYMIIYSMQYAADTTNRWVRFYINGDRTNNHYNTVANITGYVNATPTPFGVCENDALWDDNAANVSTSVLIIAFIKATPDGYLRVIEVVNDYYVVIPNGFETSQGSFMKSDATLSSITRLDFVSEYANMLTGNVRIYEISSDTLPLITLTRVR